MSRRARQNAEQLFNRYDSYSVQQHQRQKMVEAIGQAESELIRSADAEELARQFADQFALEAPTLTEAALSITVDETEVDVTGDFRFGAWGPGPHNVPGIRVTYYVPYSGDRQMFDITPSTRNLSMRPVDLGDGELQFAYERPDQDVMATKAEVDREIQQVKESLNWLRNDFQTFQIGWTWVMANFNLLTSVRTRMSWRPKPRWTEKSSRLRKALIGCETTSRRF